MNTEEFVALMDSKYVKAETADKILGKVEGLEDKIAILGAPDLSHGRKVKAWVGNKEVEAVLMDSEDIAELGKKGIFEDIMSFEIGGIPVGQAAVGGAVAILATELIDGFMNTWQPWQRGLVKLGGAWVALQWGKKVLGSTGAKAVGLLLAFDGIRDLTPIDSWMDQIAEKVSGTQTTAGLAGNQINTPAKNTPAAAPKRTSSYYAAALGGG